MKRVWIHAFMAGNLGDDLMVRILCERYPKVRFFVFADPSYHVRYKDIKNLTVFSPEDKKTRILNKGIRKLLGKEDGARKFFMKTSHASVHIGGSVFVQHLDDWSGFYGVDEQLLRLSRNLFVVGANFGPYTNPLYREQYEKLFEGYRDICFRDSKSRREFPGASNIHWAPDVVFNYKWKKELYQKEKKQVLFSVIDLKDRGGKYAICQYQEVYEKFMKELAEEFLKRGYSVKFLSFCSMQKDQEAAARILKILKPEFQDKADLLCYDQNLELCMDAFAQSELIVGTRFHSIILGMLMQKKVLPIIYDQKTRNMLADLFEGEVLEMEELTNRDCTRTADLLENAPAFFSGEICKRAEEQFKALDDFLK